MPIRIVCTNCEAAFNVADTTQGKQVKCKKCGAGFTARAVGSQPRDEAPDEAGAIRPVLRPRQSSAAEGDEPRSRSGRTMGDVLGGANGGRSRRDSAEDEDERPRHQRAEAEDRPRSRHRDDEDERPRRRRDEDEDEQPRRRARAGRGGPNVGLLIGIAAAVCLLLVGGIVGAVFLLSGDDADIAAIRQKHGDQWADQAVKWKREGGDQSQPLIEGLKNTKRSLKGVTFDGDPLQNALGFAMLLGMDADPIVPGPIVLNPDPWPQPNPFPQGNDQITTVAEALKLLKTGDSGKQNRAVFFLRNADPNVPERTEIARLLDGLQDVQSIADRQYVLIRWATKAEVPTLLKLAETQSFTFRRGDALEALGRLQDERGLNLIVEKLGDFSDSSHARKALELYGAKARPVLIANFFHKNDGIRNHIHLVAKKVGLTDQELLPIVVQELQNPERGVKNAAADWLAKTPVIANKQTEVALALDKLLENNENRGAAMRALETWATKDNVPSLARQVKDGPARHEAFKVLAKLKDERGAEAVATQLTNFFERGRALEALKEMGKEAAAKPLVAWMNHGAGHDGWARGEARKQLKAWAVDPEELVKHCLKDILGSDADKRRNALDYLAQEPSLDKLRAEVKQTIQPSLIDNTVQNQAYAALFNWLGKEGGPILVKLVIAEPSPRRHEVMSALAKMKGYADGPLAIASRLPDPRDRRHAAKCLRELNTEAEPVVRGYLRHNDGGVRHEACEILRDIGSTTESLTALDQAARLFPKDNRLTQLATVAFQTIRARMQQNPQPQPPPVPKDDPKKTAPTVPGAQK